MQLRTSKVYEYCFTTSTSFLKVSNDGGEETSSHLYGLADALPIRNNTERVAPDIRASPHFRFLLQPTYFNSAQNLTLGASDVVLLRMSGTEICVAYWFGVLLVPSERVLIHLSQVWL
jgi:hypothetical protein